MVLEMLLPSRGQDTSDVGEIASHAEQAGETAMAYRYALLASDAANQRCAYDEALSWLDLAAATASGASESEVVDRTTAQVLKQAGWREAPPIRAPHSRMAPRVEQSDFDLPAGLVEAADKFSAD